MSAYVFFQNTQLVKVKEVEEMLPPTLFVNTQLVKVKEELIRGLKEELREVRE